MGAIEKKDTQNQANLSLFIQLLRESNDVHLKTGEAIGKQGELSNTMIKKMEDMHNDIKTIRDRKPI
jgi:hypothetical protein